MKRLIAIGAMLLLVGCAPQWNPADVLVQGYTVHCYGPKGCVDDGPTVTVVVDGSTETFTGNVNKVYQPKQSISIKVESDSTYEATCGIQIRDLESLDERWTYVDANTFKGSGSNVAECSYQVK